MGLGFSRDVGAAERARGVNRPSLSCSRSWCSSMLLPVKRVSSLLPEAKQSIPEKGSGCHRTTCDSPLHISLHNDRYQNTHLALQKDSLRIRMTKYSVIHLVGGIVWRDQEVKRNATLSLRQKVVLMID